MVWHALHQDFWGQRWHLVMHGALKRTCYLPIAGMGNPLLGKLVAFLCSGLSHEYLWCIVCYWVGFYPGQVTFFFLWCMLALYLEETLLQDAFGAEGANAALRWLWVVVVLVVFGHFFTDNLAPVFMSMCELFPIILVR